MTITQTLCQEFQTAPWQIDAVIRLLDEGCTLPFIARYRKEQHGSLDDQKLREISERLTALRALEARRQEISESLQKLDVWTEKLQSDLDAAATLAQLEDIYRPYRPKRRTRASIAKEKGLEPLADALHQSRALRALGHPVHQFRHHIGVALHGGLHRPLESSTVVRPGQGLHEGLAVPGLHQRLEHGGVAFQLLDHTGRLFVHSASLCRLSDGFHLSI